jgi:nucleotide-binding universal stress UspA family protein
MRLLNSKEGRQGKEAAMGQPQIVVGIDGSATARQAMYWAAIECERRGAELVLAHAGDAEAGPPQQSDVPTSYGHSLLAEAEVEVYESGADVAVSTVIGAESPVHLLTRLSEQADLVVVGSHGLGLASAAVLGSVAFRVAAHARCPVAVVPTGWDEQGQPGRPVVVSVPDSIGASTPLYVAFTEARARNVPVRVVRSWSRADWTGELADLLYSTGPVFEVKQADYVDRMLEPLRSLFPEVPVQVVLTSERLVGALSNAAQDACLLVLGTQFADGHSYSRLGQTTTRLLHRASCPVLVVGRSARPAVGDAVDARPAASVPAG